MAKRKKFELGYVLIDRFLMALHDGWLFPDDIAEPVDCHHGYYSAIMWRPIPSAGRRG